MEAKKNISSLAGNLLTASLLITAGHARTAHAETFRFSGFDISNTNMSQLMPGAQNATFQSMIEQAQDKLKSESKFAAFSNGESTYAPHKAAADEISTTLKYNQSYKGIEVLGNQAMFHYDVNGKLVMTSGEAIDSNVATSAKISTGELMQILADRYQSNVALSEPAKLQIIKDDNGVARLVYSAKTATSETHEGREILIDANSGEFLVEADRKCEILTRFVYDANTPQAHQNDLPSGGPSNIDMSWYKLAVNNRIPSTQQDRNMMDQAALRAYLNAGKVYVYYKSRFGRLSYDAKDAAITSVVHMGNQFNNAFWTSEFGIMAYGDGDGKMLKDLTLGLDVAAHEMTHAVTSNEANLIYQGESGALNESYSDFFGKMVDYNPSDWYIGGKVIGRDLIAKGMHGIRNMINPEEYGQPGANDSKNKVPVTGPCRPGGSSQGGNDNCGVHKNSGIPNRASYLIVQALGKEAAEKIYYNVLTQRLGPTSKFHDARVATEASCVMMFGAGSTQCNAVVNAFNTVKM